MDTLFHVLFVCYLFMKDQSALSSSPTLRKRYINPSYYYYNFMKVFEENLSIIGQEKTCLYFHFDFSHVFC